jgi:plastocyanin domain-containing protein
MNAAQWLVNLLGLASIAWIVWYFWLKRKEGVAAAVVGGVQAVAVTVRGGYEPDTIVVKAGAPVRLDFIRRESSLCSEMVVFDEIERTATLPEGETVSVEFTPETPGEISFHCQMGMLRGKVVVTR